MVETSIRTCKMMNWTSQRGRPPPQWEFRNGTLWRGRPPPKKWKKTSSISIRRAGYVGTPANLGNFAPTIGKDGRKTLDDGDAPGSTGTLAVSHSGQVALRREQVQNEHHRGKTEPQEDFMSRNLGGKRKNGDTAID
jgi:hypothetical protein